MAKKGERKAEKRLAASKAIVLPRKEKTWVVKVKAGPHSSCKSAAAGFVIRDMLQLANTMWEAKHILNRGMIAVDGRPVKDHRFPVGLFDLFTLIPEKKTYRVLLNRKDQLILREEKSNKGKKLCKVIGKSATKKGLIQLQTNDGRTFSLKKTDATVGDSLLVAVPEQNILQHFKLAAGSTGLVISGRNAGTLATIKRITPGTMRRPKLVGLATKGKEFQTTEANVFVVGEKKPAIEVEGG